LGKISVPETLSDALNEAKKDRNVLSKVIIWESGVSKSQFYRIINGKETPSLETKKRISESLSIDTKQFDLLHSQSNIGPETDTSPQRRFSPLILLTALIPLIIFGLLIANSLQKSAPSATPIVVTEKDDRTLFIKDVTIPDGTRIPVNTQFVKTWRVKNIGNVPWKNRFLMRTTPTSKLLCSSPAMVPIPETLPGETVDISVTFITPHLPGSCRTDWKTADDRGNLYFPEMHGLFSIVVVTE